MRCHVLSDASGMVLALEMPAANENGGSSRFICKTPQHSCHEVDIAPELLHQLRADGWQTVPSLRIVETNG